VLVAHAIVVLQTVGFAEAIGDHAVGVLRLGPTVVEEATETLRVGAPTRTRRGSYPGMRSDQVAA